MARIYWGALSIVLLLTSFGWGCLVVFFCLLIFILGLAVMACLMLRGYQLRKMYPRTYFLKKPLKIHHGNEAHTLHKHDQRLTGSSIIDDPLQEVLHYAFRDYIQNWYSHISDNEEFLLGVKEVVQKVIVAFSSRSKEVDWVHYLTTTLVDEFASHFRLFREAQAKVRGLQRKDPTFTSSLLSSFFDMETAMEGDICRDLVCTSTTHEIDYLKDLCEVLMYVLLPPGDFQCVISRSVVREILVNAIVIPLVQLVTDPDYVNQAIVWMCKEGILNTDGFMLVLMCTDNTNELQAVLEIVNHEIAVQRSKDTGGDDDAEIKQQLSSLSYVRRAVETRIRRLSEGTVDTDSTGMPTGIDWRMLAEPGVKLFSLHFDVVLTNNIALHYFTDYMSTVSAQGYVYFYHSVEGFKVSTEQMLSQESTSEIEHASPDLEGIREAASRIFDLYFSENATLKVHLDENLLKKLFHTIQTETPVSTWFDEAVAKVYDIMQEEPYFPSFKKSQNYIKLLAELDLLKEINIKTEDDGPFLFCNPKHGSKFISFKCNYDTRIWAVVSKKDNHENCLVVFNTAINSDEISLSDSISISSLEHDEYCLDYLVPDTMSTQDRVSRSLAMDEVPPEYAELTAQIYNTAIANEAGNTYAVYAISVTRRDAQGSEEKWCVVRRYSDFRDFHFSIVQKFPLLSNMQFPGKKTFNNLSPQFLEKRTNQLSEYLQCLMNPDLWMLHPGLKVMLLQFLEPKVYEKGRKPISKTVNAIVNPLRSSMRSVGHIVKAVPDTVMDGLKGGFVRAFGKRGPSADNDFLSKVAAGLDVEGEDNIPLRILLLLMDEVFDLKSKDQWFRKRIVILLRQIINATYGDTINRKILDFVQRTTSAEQMAEYIKAFKQAMWPNGSLAVPAPDRELNTKMRTRIGAKLVMLCSLPDELKHVIGSETARKGVLYVFEMFQHPELNRRLFYVLLEGILETLFPDNAFPTICRRLHSQSQRTASRHTKWPISVTSTDCKIAHNR